MAKLSVADIVDKHARRLKGATEDITKGVNNVTEAPTKKAAQKIDKMKAQLIKAFDSGKVKRRLEATTLDDWKTPMLTKGIANIATGLDLKKDKITKFYDEFIPFQDRITEKVRAMDDSSLEANIQRMTTQVRETAKFVRKG